MFPSDVKYTKDHEWIRPDGDIYVVGITSFASEQLGDVTYVELPEVGTELNIDDEIATVESVKAASDLYAPVSGIIAAVNEALEDQPELVNEGPFGEGWFLKMENINVGELDSLMDANDYEKYVQEQIH